MMEHGPLGKHMIVFLVQQLQGNLIEFAMHLAPMMEAHIDANQTQMQKQERKNVL